jgi:hypothetical protein
VSEFGTWLSYATEAEADAYFRSSPSRRDWFAEDAEDRRAALAEATRHVDTYRFSGAKSDPYQDLEFPRDGDTEVPNPVKASACEQALYLLTNPDWEQRLNAHAQGVTSQSTGGSVESYGARAELLSAKALRLLRPYLLRGGKLV